MHEPRLTTALYSQWNRVSRATAQRDLADLVARGLPEPVLREDAGPLMYYDNALMRTEAEWMQGRLL